MQTALGYLALILVRAGCGLSQDKSADLEDPVVRLAGADCLFSRPSGETSEPDQVVPSEADLWNWECPEGADLAQSDLSAADLIRDDVDLT